MLILINTMSSIQNDDLKILCDDAYQYRSYLSHQANQILFSCQRLSFQDVFSIYMEVASIPQTSLYWSALLINFTLDSQIIPESSLQIFLYIKPIQSFNPSYFKKFTEALKPVLFRSIHNSQSELLYSWAECLKDLINYPSLKCCVHWLKIRLKADLLIKLETWVSKEDLKSALILLQYFQKVFSVFTDFLKFFDVAFRFILKLVKKNANDLGKRPACINILQDLAKYQDGFGKRNLKMFEAIEAKLGCGHLVRMREVQIINDLQICPGFNANSIVLDHYPIYQKAYPDYQLRVFKGSTEDNVMIAAKEYTIINSNFDLKSVDEEIRVLTFLNKNSEVFTVFPKLYKILQIENRIILYMEYAGKTLMDMMTDFKRVNQLIESSIIEEWMIQLIQSLAWLSNCRIFHRNIKPHNILVSSNFNIKLIDFQFSTECDTIESSMMPTAVNPIQGPEGYLAPELIEAVNKGEKVAKYKIGKADIYSLGLSFLQIFTLEKITGLNFPGNYPKIKERVSKIHAKDWVKHLLLKMLVEDRKERLSFCKCLEEIPSGNITIYS